MFIGKINNYLVPSGMANTVIPIRTIRNTNDRLVNKNGVISFLQNGDYDLDATISVSATESQNVNVSVFADDGERVTVPATIPAAPDGETVGVANVSLIDAIKVILTRYFSVANIYIGVDQSDVTVDGYVRIEYVK